MPRVRMKRKKLTVDFYREGNKFIAFSPALNLSTCGNTEDEAKKRFEELERLFFEEIDRMGTLEDVLFECGWRKITHPQRCWQPPLP